MINLRTVEHVHHILIHEFGGNNSVKDTAALKVALNRPYATFEFQELYPTPVDKASALFESILISQPFANGNKRTAYLLMRLILLHSGFDISATQDEKHKIICSACSGEAGFDEIKIWINTKLTKSIR